MARRAHGSAAWALLTLLGVGCGAERLAQGPGVSFVAPLAEGQGDEAPPRAAARPAPSQAAAPVPSASGSVAAPPHGQPDPEPLRQREQLDVVLLYEGGKISVLSVRPFTTAKPVVTERRMGRWALELWIGTELVERVRFDFPLLGAEELPPAGRRKPLAVPPSFADSTAEQRLRVPLSERARRAVLVDRATGVETPLPWPLAPTPRPSEAAPASRSAEPRRPAH